MTTIAHLTDLHLLEDDLARRSVWGRMRLGYLTMGRRNRPAERRRRAVEALRRAWDSGADHLVITGDLTEDGTEAQFEVLAAVLHEAELSPERVTLVPGNHDTYAERDGFRRALDGPLRPYAPTSTPGSVTVLDDVAIVAVSTAVHQPVTQSWGAIESDVLDRIATLASGKRLGHRAVVLAQHHPPMRHPVAPMQWIDGLRDHDHLTTLLERHDRLHVMHGHIHQRRSSSLRESARPQVFCAAAAFGARASVRLYDAGDGAVAPR